jgi:hypothetical protein
VDRTHRGKIALSSLQEILTSALSLDFKAEPPRWNKLIDTIETVCIVFFGYKIVKFVENIVTIQLQYS